VFAPGNKNMYYGFMLYLTMLFQMHRVYSMELNIAAKWLATPASYSGGPRLKSLPRGQLS
jgi:hypothetical protein